MKKWVALLLMLALMSSTALAGSLSGLEALMSAPLPDPAQALGTEGSVMMENYAFTEEYLCTAYVYPIPADWNAFEQAYRGLLAQSGFTMTDADVGGYAGYQLDQEANPEQYALLVPNFQGQLLLLVRNGMTMAAVTEQKENGSLDGLLVPQVTQEPQEDYFDFTYCGYPVHLTKDKKSGYSNYDFDVGSTRIHAYNLWFSGEGQILRNVFFRIPRFTQVGAVLEGNRKNDAANGNVEIELFGSPFFGEEFRVHDSSWGEDDFYRLTIDSITETDKGTVVTGTFEGCFHYGDETIEDGVFRVTLKEFIGK